MCPKLIYIDSILITLYTKAINIRYPIDPCTNCSAIYQVTEQTDTILQCVIAFWSLVRIPDTALAANRHFHLFSQLFMLMPEYQTCHAINLHCSITYRFMSSYINIIQTYSVSTNRVGIAQSVQTRNTGWTSQGRFPTVLLHSVRKGTGATQPPILWVPGVKHLYDVLRSRTLEFYRHASLCLYGVVLNKLRTRTNLPLRFLVT